MSNRPLTVLPPAHPSHDASHRGWDIVEVAPLVDFDDLLGILKRRLPLLLLLPVVGLALALVYVYKIA
ncbi:MAG TPA: hypothetical protein PLA50_18730, partial [Bacteroidia bacterium]|nr:hypothetical protein [Bacteroidia bacterium]